MNTRKRTNIIYAILWLLIAAFLLAAFTSCSTTRKLKRKLKQTTEQVAQNDIETRKTAHTFNLDSLNLVYARQVAAATKLFRLVFDTTKPIDSTTGLPPLKEVTIIENSISESTSATNKEVKQSYSVADSTVIDKSKIETYTTINEQIDTKQANRTSSWWWILGLCGSLIFVLFLLFYKIKLL